MLGLWAIGEDTLCVEVPGQGSQPTVTTREFASHSFVAQSAASPEEAEYVPGRISRGLEVTRTVSSGPEGMFGGLVTASFGDIEFGNPDGELDSLLNSYPDGRPVHVKIGFSHQDSVTGREIDDDFNDFTDVFIGVAGSWEIDQERAILRLRDPGMRLQDDIAKSHYRGTGGEEGDLNLEDKSRPSALGVVFNAEPQLVSPGYLIYQIHGGPVQSIDAVYEAGVSLEFDADVATFDLLQQRTVPPGEYATCIERGYIKLGSDPDGRQITVDLHGDAGFPGEPWSDDDTWSDASLWQSGAGPATLAGHVALKVLLEYAKIPYTEIDELSFTIVDTQVHRTVGIYIGTGESRSLENVLGDIGLSSGICFGTNKMGKFAAFRLDLNVAPTFTFTADQIIEIDREALPYGVPWFEWSLGYKRAWQVQSTTNEVAGIVEKEHRQFIGQEFRYAKAHSSHIRAAHWTSRPTPIIETVLVERSEAQGEANKKLQFYDVGRTAFRVVVKNALFLLEIGTVVTLRLDRFDLDAGQNFVVTSVREDLGEMVTEFVCFG
jgi:hypothetical protein